MIFAINFADINFATIRKFNTHTAYSKGKADIVIEYSPSDIDESFLAKNKQIFNYKRGLGLWLWKPYFIKKTLDQMKFGDYLFYSDAGSYFINKIKYLIDALDKCNQPIMGYGLPLLERQFTKKESFILMDYDDYENNQVLATFILLKKTPLAVKFVEEWLHHTSVESIVSPKYFSQEIIEFEDFVAHREDQSIFSILYHKYDFEVFKDPSQFGNRSWQYAWIKQYESKKDIFRNKWSYRPIKYSRFSYPQVVVSVRDPKIDINKFRIKEKIRTILWRLGVFNKFYYRTRYGASLKP